MNKEQRRTKIVQEISKRKKISVQELSDLFEVSTVTIRKDLSSLDDEGLIKRSHNYAEIFDDDSISRKLSFHFEEKTQIAQRALDLVSDNETIMIESGSCCAIFAKALALQKEGIRIITNSVFIADYIGLKENVEIILLGGIYQQKSQVLIGPVLADCVKNYKVDKLFIGTDGYSKQWGFSNKDPFRCEAVRHMAQRSEEVIVLTESHKFDINGTMPIGLKDKKISVVTDKNINKEAKDHLIASGVDIYFA